MKRKMEQDRILGWKRSTAAQWAAIQAHGLTIPPVPNRAALWQTNSNRGRRFTECFDYLLRDIAKKHQHTLTELLRAPVAAVAAAAPIAVGNDRKLSQCLYQMWTVYANMANADLAGPRSVRLWIDEASKVRPDSPLPAGLDKVSWQAGEHVYWMEMSEPTFQNLLDSIDTVLERGFGYRALVGATK